MADTPNRRIRDIRDDGLDGDRVAVELRRISWRTARAALQFLAE
jgi:hypothetical protein